MILLSRLGFNQSRKVACGSKKHLEPHHIVHVKPYDKLYVDVNNGAILCKKCHREYHELYSEVNGVTLTKYAQSRLRRI